MLWKFAFITGLALAWIIAWFAYIGPRLRAYQRTAGIMARLDMEEHGLLGWLLLKINGLKTALALFVTSMFTGGWGLIENALGLDPSALAPFQDSTLWKALLRDEMAIKAAAIATFASALLVLHGKLKDVRIIPTTSG